jgi:ABC-type lipoprotein release transport system permease subunit
VFYVRFLGAELRRRPARTALTALGLALGVGLVVIVGALSAGLDEAQEKALAPLTGVGTDMRVTRPLTKGSADFMSLSDQERRRLLDENPQGGFHFDPGELGDPGEPFADDQLLSSQLSFPVSAVRRVSTLERADGAVAALSLQAVRIEGTVPEPGTVVNPHAGGYDITSTTVTGVDVRSPDLAPVTPQQVRRGEYFSPTRRQARDEAILDLAYARQIGVAVGDMTSIAGKRFEVVGLADAPLGGSASNAYLELRRLQQMSGREGRANVMLVRAASPAAVDPLSREIRRQVRGADVVSASQLADRVGGSLADARNLSATLGTALAVVVLAAAFLIATLLSLSSVQKRVRELGTLKALGWRTRLVVRQVGAESLVQGLLGGLGGVALGLGGATLIDRLELELDASVAPEPAGLALFGQGQIATGSTEVVLGAPIEGDLLALAVALALLGGLFAGVAGGLRAARLRPAEALRSVG